MSRRRDKDTESGVAKLPPGELVQLLESIPVTGALLDALADVDPEAALRLAESAANPCFRLDADLRILDTNSAFRRITGFNEREIGDFPRGTPIRPDYREEVLGRLAVQLRRGSRSLYVEYPVVTKSGKEVWFAQETSPSADAAGSPGLRAVAEEITERVRAEETRNRLAAVLAGTCDAAVALDRDGVVLSCNAGMQALYGFAPEDIVGRSFAKLIPDSANHELQEMLANVREGRSGSTTETGRRTADGEEVRVSSTSTVIRDINGRPDGILLVERDITHSVRAQQALLESEQRLLAVLDSVLDAIIVINEAGVIQSVNAAALSIFGYRAEELLARNVTSLMPEPYRSEHDQYVERYLRTGEAKIIGKGREIVGRRKDGTTFPLDLAVTEVRTAGGRQFVGVARDISERKRAEEQIGNMMLSLEKRNDDMQAILNQLHLGVFVTDDEGRVSFLSRFCQELFSMEPQQVLGRRWENVLPFQDRYKPMLMAACHHPGENSRRLNVRVESEGGGTRWLDVQVKTDPRNRGGRLFLLYDVSEVHDLREQLEERSRFGELIGNSEGMKLVYRQIEDLAQVDATVLIEGETGTGKELVARALHESSPRKGAKFVPVNCASLTETLVASQLFGHVKGSFTGASSDQKGVFETAEKGTVFLDEVGDLPLNQQTSLLRVLQEREISRVGEAVPRKVDVRVLAATNRDLSGHVESGRFREDLFYRLRVARIRVPPLRERKEDIPLLALHFVRRYRTRTGKQVRDLDTESMRMMMDYDWPGNVRELQNAIESAMIRCRNSTITPADLPPELRGAGPPGILRGRKNGKDQRQELITALAETNGNRAAAARLLHIGRTTLYRRMVKYGLAEEAEE